MSGYAGHIHPLDHFCGSNCPKHTPEHDSVTRPAHYARATLEPIQLIDALELGFYEGNVVKYVCRHEHKNGLEDLEKAAWYLDRLIAKAKGEQRYPTIPTATTELVEQEERHVWAHPLP